MTRQPRSHVLVSSFVLGVPQLHLSPKNGNIFFIKIKQIPFKNILYREIKKKTLYLHPEGRLEAVHGHIWKVSILECISHTVCKGSQVR